MCKENKLDYMKKDYHCDECEHNLDIDDLNGSFCPYCDNKVKELSEVYKQAYSNTNVEDLKND